MRVTDQNDIDANALRAELEEARRIQEQCLASGVNHSVWMEGAFKGADLAFGYWKEGSTVTRGLLKGEKRLQDIAGSKEAAQLRVLRVSCREAAEAEAMYRVWGDGRATA